ncbi:serine O-acetyltransferase [Eubacterium pyruvativorans]|uniref:Serine acetyltransferase n=1 Tax=Eubacterium pyruvativorans TaxID=155865 RepID=A0A1I7GPU1_9FIRM|nr:serine O-acetyltransferase [Eubacterium pyruvativorans]SFO11542.1 serine O-acetyltransferase [Eubacterium pyruvativorans]SFU50468.1 serine O-acetyltransferase [Eubacterium pyruvativorans]HAT83194.1 serine acetyltransferase [Eubacterium sp.]
MTKLDISKLDLNDLCRFCEDGAEIDEESLNVEINGIMKEILGDYSKGRDIDKMNAFDQPDQGVVVEIINELMMILFPGYYREKAYRTRDTHTKLSVLIEDVMYHLRKQIEVALLYDDQYAGTKKYVRKRAAQKLCLDYFRKIPAIREYLDTDIQAFYDGDPAANSKDEIVLAYPGLYAIAVYRLAHALFELNVPLLPRMMTEYAHRETGVDIHPGATIGKYFFIDHAVGIVVGSTSVIGDHVKLYQGVTIGALSVKEGHKLHGTKRHPTIEDNVTLYAGATVLGGNTVIGEGSVIGGNSFVTKSVEPHTTVTIKTHEMVYDSEGKKTKEDRELEQDAWFYVI